MLSVIEKQCHFVPEKWLRIKRQEEWQQQTLDYILFEEKYCEGQPQIHQVKSINMFEK
jgi:hypothetical protein